MTAVSGNLVNSIVDTFPQCSQGEFVEQSRTSLFGDNFLYLHNLSVQCRK